jgi:hypothetical protein
MRYTIPDLLPSTTYAIQMRANAGGLHSEWSRSFLITTVSDTRKPDVPQNVTWISSGDSFHGEWDAVTENEQGDAIKIDRYELELVGGSTTQHVSIPPQEAGTRVSYDLSFETNRALFSTPQGTVTMRVRAVNASNVAGNYSSTISASNPVPGVPTGVTANAMQDSIQVAWTAPTGPTDNDIVGYNVYVSTTSGFTPGSGNKVFTGDTTRFTYRTTTYAPHYFRVRAVDKFGQESANSTEVSATPSSPFVIDTTPPAVPVMGTPTASYSSDGQNESVSVSWTPVSDTDVAGYVVGYRQTGGATNWAEMTVDKEQSSVRLDGLILGRQYDVRVRSFDWQFNYSAWAATQTTAAPPNFAPSTPTAPTVAANTLQIQVTIPGTKASDGTAMDADVVHYEVYASTTNGFSTSSSNLIGTVKAGPAMVGTFNIPASGGAANQTWYVKIRAIDFLGVGSSASAQASGSVLLIAATNIVDATITNAKIASLAADKITAGTGIINDITVKSKLTLGDASNIGYIETYDYTTSGGTTGAQFSKNGIIIKTGAVEAAALKIQSSPNIVPGIYADFESPNISQSVKISQGTPIVSASTSPKFNTYSLDVAWTTLQSANPIVYLGTSTTDYNIPTFGGISYIISGYFWGPSAVATNVQFKIKWSDGTFSTVGTSNLSASGTPAGATRISSVVTAPAGVTGSVALVESSTLTALGGWRLDGVQVEEKIGALSTPSSWKPPGNTRIDGGMIRTGSIQSNVPISGTDSTPMWSIPMNGSAAFANLMVRGNAVIGSIGETTPSMLSSANYVSGQVGYQFRSDGTADLRGIGADAIAVDSLAAGDLNTNGEINLLSTMVATGDMGERMRVGEEGFYVYDADQVTISTKALSAGTATIVTSTAHGFTTGNKLLITGLGNPFDGVWIIASTSGATSFTYVVDDTTTTVTTTAAPSGVAKSRTSLEVNIQQDPVIRFPTDGTLPSLVTGDMTVNELTMPLRATLAGNMTVERTGNITIAASQGAPIVSMNGSSYWPAIVLDTADFGPDSAPTFGGVQFFGGFNMNSMTIGHDGNWYTCLVDGTTLEVYRVSPTTGDIISRVYTETNATGTGASFARGSASITYGTISGANRYFIAYEERVLGAQDPYVSTNYVKARVLDTTFSDFGKTTADDVIISQAVISNSSGYAFYNAKAQIGWNFTRSQPIVGRVGANGGVRVAELTYVSGTESVSVFNDDPITDLGATPTSSVRLGFVARGSFDMGSDTYLFSGGDLTYQGKYIQNQFVAYSTSGPTYSRQTSKEWPGATPIDNIQGGFYDAANKFFYDVTLHNPKIRRYRATTTNQSYSVGAGNNVTFQVSYAWVNSTGPVRTQIAPGKSITISKRADMAVTIPQTIPYDSANPTVTPNQAYVYLAKTASSLPTNSNLWHYWNTISYPEVSASIDMNNANTGANPATTNGFTSGGMGSILLGDGTYYVRGDGNAKLAGLTLGPSAITSWNWGVSTGQNTNASGNISVAHGLGGGKVPLFAIATGNSLNNARIFQWQAADATNITFNVKKDDGTDLVSSTVSFRWFVIA